MIIDRIFSGPADELDRWMVNGGLQSLWTYHKDKTFLELIKMIIDDQDYVITLGPALSDKQFLDKLYDQLRSARENS